MTSLLIFLVKGAALWLFAGLLVTGVWAVALTWVVLSEEEDEVAKRRYRSIMVKIDAILPGWNHVLARWVYRVAAAAGFSEAGRRAVADVCSFMVGWPWVVPLIGEVVYERWNEENNDSGEGRGDQ